MAPVVRGVLVAAALCLAGPARAQGLAPPLRNAGSITVGGGWSTGPAIGGPTLRGRFSWYASSHWTLGIELGYTRRQVTAGTATATLGLMDAAITTTWSPLHLGPVMPYAFVSGGYRFVTDEDGGHYSEGATQSLSLGLGAWMRLTHALGIYLEDRWDFAHLTVNVGGAPHGTSLGGNMVCVGLVVLFDPEPDLSSE